MRKLFKHIKYYFVYLIIRCLIAIFKFLGIKHAIKLSTTLCHIISPHLTITKLAEKNIYKHLPKNTFKEGNKELIRKLWDNIGQLMGEFAFIDQFTENELNARIKITGAEHIYNLNRPYIVFSGHFANWELILRGFQNHFENLALIYKKSSNPYIDKWIFTIRKFKLKNLIASKGEQGLKDLLKSIKAKHNIITLVDQKFPSGLQVPLFNQEAMTNASLAKFALKFDYAIIPAQMIRRADSKFEVVISPPVEIEKIGSEQQIIFNITLKMNQFLEQWITEYPDQWLWWLSDRWGK